MRWLAFDIETAGREDVLAYLPEPQADKRLTDQAKIAADLERKRAEQVEKLPLDANGNRIVALGVFLESDTEPAVNILGNGLDGRPGETVTLNCFWALAKGRTLIGFRSRTFDLPVIIQRSRLLGVPVPPWRELVAPYGRTNKHIDLYDEWTLDGLATRGEVPNNLTVVCRQHGIDIPEDDAKGKDVAALLASGNLEAVRQHCARDVERTVALARKLGFIPALAQAEMVL